ncbi:MAG: TIGR04283 family arsenosugar biosynthesis glycosyltransferase [Bacteroidia bacterium]|nr:TIGR04283 family arsenosugar biosynthesis glycosyltransferase [Bacteroidia bacterium]
MKPAEPPHISIIIPVLNEAGNLHSLKTQLEEQAHSYGSLEILLIDGGSTDDTRLIATELDFKIISSHKGRAKQMNRGAALASADILYFLHADTLPSKNFDLSIRDSVASGNKAGCFRMRFDSESPFLKFFSWFSRVNHRLCRGGDQSLFIAKDLFYKLGGFDESYTVYEDSEFINRIYKESTFKIIPETVITSARKYEDRGELALQYHFGVIHLKNYLGAGPEQLYTYYKKNIESY